MHSVFMDYTLLKKLRKKRTCGKKNMMELKEHRKEENICMVLGERAQSPNACCIYRIHCFYHFTHATHRDRQTPAIGRKAG